MRDVEVSIERLAFGGAGLGHWSGKVCFVPFSAPGDLVLARVVAEKKSYLWAESRENLIPSSLRIAPLCPIFGCCGGCDWQHLPYPVQCHWKEEIAAELLWRIARVPRSCCEPICPAQESYKYRSRIQLKLRYVQGVLHLGFYRGGSHFVIGLPPEGCAVAHPAVNQTIAILRQCLDLLPEPDRVPQIDVTSGEDGKTAVVVHYLGSRIEEMAAFLRDNLPSNGIVGGVALQSGRKSTMQAVVGIQELAYGVHSGGMPGSEKVDLIFSLGGFSQVNYRQNRQLFATVYSWAQPARTDRLLDLYCGNGNFTIPLATRVGEAVGIESYEPSIRDARTNAAVNGVNNARFLCADVAEEVGRLAANSERFDLVLLDPPRSGAGAVVGQVPKLGPRAIVYVSCDPATLARDAAILAKNGYRVERSVVVDMFPQTHHIESVTLFIPAGTG